MSLELRDYQKDSINAFWDYVAKGGRSGIICAPTGSGEVPHHRGHLQNNDRIVE